MTMTLPARETQLAAASARIPIPVAKVTTYSDRVAGTVASTHYLSDRPLLYTMDGAEREFEPALATFDPVVGEMAHIPPPRGGIQGARDWGLEIANVETESGRLFDLLNADTLRFARIEFGLLYVAPWEGESRYDLRGLGADQHRIAWKGEVVRPLGSEHGARMRIQCQPERPNIPWSYANAPTINDPHDLGKRLAIPYGAVNKVPCIRWQVGTTLVLGNQITDDDGLPDLTLAGDVNALPSSGSFTIRVGAEEMTVTRSGASLDVEVTARGVNNTDAVRHQAGEVVLELISEAVIVLASVELSALRELYMLSPFGGNLLVPVATGTVNLADDTLVSGKTVATVRYTEAELRAVLESVQQATKVLTQPDFSDAGSPTESTLNYNSSSTGFGYSPGSRFDWSNPTMTMNLSTGTARRVFLGFANQSSTDILRWRAEVQVDIAVPSGTIRYWTQMRLNGSNINQWFADYSGTHNNVLRARGWSSSVSDLADLNSFEIRLFAEYDSGTIDGATITVDHARIIYETAAVDTIERTVDVEVTGGVVGNSLEWYADLTGPTVPEPFSDGFTPESSPSYDEAGVSHAQVSGVDQFSVDETVIDACEATDDWSAGGGSSPTLALNVNASRGSNSVQATRTGAGSITLTLDLGGRDMASEVLAFEAWYSRADDVGATDQFEVRLRSTGDFDRTYLLGTDDGLTDGEFRTVLLSVNDGNEDSEDGSFDIADVQEIRVRLNDSGGASGDFLRIDNWRVISALSLVAQQNGLTDDPDMSADGSPARYEVDAAVSGAALIDHVEIYFDNATGSGTTRPTNYRELSALATITTPTATDSADTNTPTVTAIDTLGIELVLAGNGAYDSTPEPPRFDLTAVRVRDDSENPYDADVGDVLEHPADVFRHLNAELVTDSPLTLDPTSLGALSTNVPDAVVACDLRDLGEDFDPIMGRLGFEARTNVVERAGVLRFLSAESDYEFPAAAVTLTGWKQVRRLGRPAGDVQTEHGALYDLDRTGLFAAEEGFLQSLRADQDGNDISAKVADAALLAARQAFGVRRGPVIGFLTSRDADGVKDAFGYYVAEGLRADDDAFEFESADPAEALTLEEGDIFEATPDLESSARKLRLIARTDPLHGLPSLTAVEVP